MSCIDERCLIGRTHHHSVERRNHFCGVSWKAEVHDGHEKDCHLCNPHMTACFEDGCVCDSTAPIEATA